MHLNLQHRLGVKILNVHAEQAAYDVADKNTVL